MERRGLERLSILASHIIPGLSRNNTSSSTSLKDENGNYRTVDLMYKDGRTKLDYFKAKGWGFKDTEFVLDGQTGQMGLTGDKYIIQE
jgi:hypothetical protein